MTEAFPNTRFERYADDIVVHCESEKEAYNLKNRIEGRMKMFKLTLHPVKTRVVYTGRNNDFDKRGHELSRKFTFLGYDFKPRMWKGRMIYTPGMGKGALKKIGQTIKEKWHLKQRQTESLKDIAKTVDSAIRGWVNYYGHHRRSDLYKMARVIDGFLVRFLKKKTKTKNSPQQTWNKAWLQLSEYKKENPREFSHWYMIGPSKR
jgi:RNA-directed DNA polymerase